MSSQGSKDAARTASRGYDAAAAEQARQFDLTREDTAPYRDIGRQALGTLGSIYGYRIPQAAGAGAGAPSGTDASSGWRINPNGSLTRTLQAQQGTDGSYSVPGNAIMPGELGGMPNGMPGAPDYTNFFASPDYQFRRAEGQRGIERSASARGLLGSGNALTALADYNSGLAAGEFGNWFNRQATLAGIGQSGVNTSASAGSSAAANIGNALIGGANARGSGIGGQYDAWGNALGTIGGIAYDRWGGRK